MTHLTSINQTHNLFKNKGFSNKFSQMVQIFCQSAKIPLNFVSLRHFSGLSFLVGLLSFFLRAIALSQKFYKFVVP